MTEQYFFISRTVPNTYFFITLTISLIILLFFIFEYYKNRKKDPSYLWAFLLGFAFVAVMETLLYLLKLRDFGPDHNVINTLIMGLFEGGVPTSVIFYLTRKIFERDFKIVAIFLGLFIIVLISILSVILIIGLENTSTSYRIMSHPYMILILIITYSIIFIFFWIIPPEIDKKRPIKELTETRKFILYFFFLCLIFSLLLLLFWIPAGFRYVHEGTVGGPYVPVDIPTASLWLIYNGILENPAPFIAPAAIGIRFKLMKIE